MNMKKIYKRPQILALAIIEEDFIAASLTGKAEGLGNGGASSFGEGEDVNGDAKNRVDFSEDIEQNW